MTSTTISQTLLILAIPHRPLVIITYNRNRTSPHSGYSNRKNLKNNTLRILQWNCQGMRSKLAFLQFTAQDYDVICLQESLLHDANKPHLKGFQVISKGISGPGLRGICTCFRTNISYTIADLSDITHPSIELLGTVIEVDNSPCLIVPPSGLGHTVFGLRNAFQPPTKVPPGPPPG